jgi:plastocyanin
LNLPVSRLSTPAAPAPPGLWLLALGLAVAGAFSLGACGNSSLTTTSTTTTTTLPPGVPAVTIGAGSLSPKQIEINVGQHVTFVNNDTAAHEIVSNPHPSHTDCPPINEVGSLAAGQSRATGAFTLARTCGYHDEGQPDNASLQGTIIIH